MRSRAVPAAVAAAALAALSGCERHRDAVADACAQAGFSGGSSAADGVFFAVVPRPCSGAGETVCEVADGTGSIDREVVAAGIDQDCVAFNQFVGAGFNAIPGYVTGSASVSRGSAFAAGCGRRPGSLRGTARLASRGRPTAVRRRRP
jgi:hypothetical protein